MPRAASRVASVRQDPHWPLPTCKRPATRQPATCQPATRQMARSTLVYRDRTCYVGSSGLLVTPAIRRERPEPPYMPGVDSTTNKIREIFSRVGKYAGQIKIRELYLGRRSTLLGAGTWTSTRLDIGAVSSPLLITPRPKSDA